MSSIQTDRINNWIEQYDILDNNQFGFRRGKDTSDAAARLFACIDNARSTNKALHAAFLDVAKAYDSVQLSGTWSIRLLGIKNIIT